MKIASITEVKAQFSAYLRQSEQGPVVVTRNGKPVAALLALRDDEELESLVHSHPVRLRSILQATRHQICAGEGLSHEELWRQLDEETRGV
jgi:prevent-host-death family protein